MPKNKDDIINGTKYHSSIKKGDEVTSLIYGLHRGTKATVVGYAPIQFGGYFKSVLVKTDTGYTFYIKQNHLCYWEDFPK
jgi:hypothetical protein